MMQQLRLCPCGNPMRSGILWEVVDEDTIGWVVFVCDGCKTVIHDYGENNRGGMNEKDKTRTGTY